MSDGLEDVLLLQAWGGRQAGETVRVDPVRAAWLRDEHQPPPDFSEEELVAPRRRPQKERK